ncbi:uncharacterized protein N7483_010374 [Penicillium malachiteum]|uniref:uncharacterized protein n=1 Tax=Penicillium malachiteum TaxID=1324776 RepID=UPI0025495B41|nr:uncharacterized protein N7483_010374 [Penicillium malachiteum]KAJ5713193.1 hypothetical protein N7483_010374 [Penicillium malachiteum]
MGIAKAADPAILEGIEATEAQPLMDKTSSEKIYQGYCSAGKQRCNFCDERGKLLWTRCGQEHIEDWPLV